MTSERERALEEATEECDKSAEFHHRESTLAPSGSAHRFRLESEGFVLEAAAERIRALKSKPGVPEGGATSRVLTCEDVGRPQCCPDPAPPAPHPEALSLVNAQAEDPALWAPAETAPEAYIQRALRALHAAVEAAPHPEVVDRGDQDSGPGGRGRQSPAAAAPHSYTAPAGEGPEAGINLVPTSPPTRRLLAFLTGELSAAELVRLESGASYSPPSLLRTAEQERAAAVAFCEKRMEKAVNESDEIAADIWEAAADAFRRGRHLVSRDHLQTPGSDPAKETP